MNYSLNDLKDIFGKNFSNISSIQANDILEKIGLQKVPSTTSYVLPAIGLFGVGMIVGAGLGMLFAPRSGHDLREDIGSKASDLARKVGMTGRGRGDGNDVGGDYEAGRGGGFARGYEAGSTYESGIGAGFEGKGTYPGAGEGGA